MAAVHTHAIDGKDRKLSVIAVFSLMRVTAGLCDENHQDERECGEPCRKTELILVNP